MAYLKVSEARAAAQPTLARLQKSASGILKQESRSLDAAKTFDVFLSHSYQDAEVILGVKAIMESLNLTVYVDWIDDSGLDRTKVTHKTAEILRRRMRAAGCLVYAHSSNSGDSTWMPWELGYFDGFKPAHLWILPIVSDYDSEFKSQEYLSLYPTVDKISSLAGHINLGFTDAGVQKRDIPLVEAARGTGVYFTGTG
ncbi:MAG: hypothetical protein BGO25_10280 [Acidobacteriales bacterium 59-55]|nr:hypothetical protein [Terriglobales bacterium]OJV42675.1 MAG: hypothetical protein BGO25_10280 [Acidobacteriales bacterium 59-55]